MAQKKILLEIRQGKKKSTEGSTEEKEGTALKMQNEIQEDKKKSTEGSTEENEIQEDKKRNTEDVNKQVDSRYARREHLLTPLKHHRQSVDLLTGAIGPLLPKLLEIELEEYNLEKTVMLGVLELHFEMEIMKATLWKVAEREPLRERLDFYATDARDLSYEAEDFIESYLVCEKGSRRGTWRYISWMASRGMPRHEMAYKINGITRQARLLNEQLTGLISHDLNSDNHPTITSEPHLSNLYTYTKELVGIKGSRDEVIRKLTDGTNDELKIVSIVGIGGLGKTTLAKSVYDRVQMQFDCRAFVSVSTEPDMKKILMDILLQIDKKKYMSLCGATLDTEQLIAGIRGLLANKRYLIIVDDIRDVVSWEIINRVLVDTRLGSRVLTTTRSSNVAEKAGGVYMLSALSPQESKALFNTRLLCGKEELPSDLSAEFSMNLQKCDGVPLAIIAVASLLAQNQRSDWSTAKHIINGGADKMNTSDILAHIIYNMPYHLRACLLHLHIFPVGHLIKKENLIWKWAAEGFIVQEKDTGLFELGEAYFKELVNRNLVMPVEDDSDCGLVIGCRVHHLVLDGIRALSNEENFVMVHGDNMQETSSGSRARRLAVQKWAVEHGDPFTDCRPERLRSFNTMGCHFGTKLESLSRFKVLRVVSIEECTLFEGSKPSNLEHLGKLLLLRYLGLYKTPIDKLPEEIGDLIYLQTLDLRGTTVKTLPKRVAQLRQLKCLRADEGTSIPDWMGNLTSLEELRLGEVTKSVHFVNKLVKLKELRHLEIWAERLDEKKGEALVRSVNNLRKMQVLRLMGVSSSVDYANWEGYNPPGQLREVRITNSLSRLPAWINVSHVPLLSCLHVDVKAVGVQDLENLGGLPELVSLKLLMPSYVFPPIEGDGAFPKLRYFGTSAPVIFLPEAMPCLEFFGFKVQDGEACTAAIFSVGTLENFPLLQKVEVEISSSGGLDVGTLHEALRCAVDKHPNSPNLDFMKTDQVEITG